MRSVRVLGWSLVALLAMGIDSGHVMAAGVSSDSFRIGPVFNSSPSAPPPTSVTTPTLTPTTPTVSSAPITPTVTGDPFPLTSPPRFALSSTPLEQATLRVILIRKTSPYSLLLIKSYPYRNQPPHAQRPKELSLSANSELTTPASPMLETRQRIARLKQVEWSRDLTSTFLLDPNTLSIDRETASPLRPPDRATKLLDQFYVIIHRTHVQGYSDASLFIPPNKTVLISQPLSGISNENGEFASPETLQHLRDLETRCQTTPCADSRTPYVPPGQGPSLQYLSIHLFSHNSQQMDYLHSLSHTTTLPISQIPEPIRNAEIAGGSNLTLSLVFDDLENLNLNLKKSQLPPKYVLTGGVRATSPLEMVSIKSDGSVIRKVLKLPDSEDEHRRPFQPRPDTAMEIPPDAQLSKEDYVNLSDGGALLTVVGVDGVRRHVVGQGTADYQRFRADESWATEVATTETPRDRNFLRPADFLVENNQAVESPSWLAPGAVALVSLVGAGGVLKHYAFVPQTGTDGSTIYVRQEMETPPWSLSDSGLQAQVQTSRADALRQPTFYGSYQNFLNQTPLGTVFPFADPYAFKVSLEPYQFVHDLGVFFAEHFEKFKSQNPHLQDLTPAKLRRRFLPFYFLMDESGQPASYLCATSRNQNSPMPRPENCRSLDGEKVAGTIPWVTQFPSGSGSDLKHLDTPTGQLIHPMKVSLTLHGHALSWDFFSNQDLNESSPNYRGFFNWARSHPSFQLRTSAVVQTLPGFKLPPSLSEFVSESQRSHLGAPEAVPLKERTYQEVLGLLSFGLENLATLYPRLQDIRLSWPEEPNILELLKALATAFAYDQLPILDAKNVSQQTLSDGTQTVSNQTFQTPQFQGLRFVGNRTYRNFKQSNTYWRSKNEFDGYESTFGGTGARKSPALLDENFTRRGVPPQQSIASALLEHYDPIPSVLHAWDFHLKDPVLTQLSWSRLHPDHLVKALLLMREALRSNLYQALIWYMQHALAKSSAHFYEQEYNDVQEVIDNYLSSKIEAQYRSKHRWIKAGFLGAAVTIGALSALVTGPVGPAAVAAACGKGALLGAAGWGLSTAVDECYLQSDESNVQIINSALAAYLRHQTEEDLSKVGGSHAIAITPYLFDYKPDVYTEITEQKGIANSLSTTTPEEISIALREFTGLTCSCPSGAHAPLCTIDNAACVKSVTIGAVTSEIGTRSTKIVLEQLLSKSLPGSIPQAGVIGATTAGITASQITQSLAANVVSHGVTQFGIGVALGFLEAYFEASVTNEMVSDVEDKVVKFLTILFDSYRTQMAGVQEPTQRDVILRSQTQIELSRIRQGMITKIQASLRQSGSLTDLQKVYLAGLYAELLVLHYNKDYWAALSATLYMQSMNYYVEYMMMVFKYYLMLRRALCELGSRAGTPEVAQQYYCSDH